MRDVDPFDYWEDHSSAIEGLGGAERSPDPRYLFHTRYHHVRPGRARFVVRLNEVRASFGELSIRVHAWKPEGDSLVSLVAGARALLEGGPQGGSAGGDTLEIVVPVQFAAQKDVLYALYGYLSEDSDVAAGALQVAIDEVEDSGDPIPAPPISVLAPSGRGDRAGAARALLHYGRTNAAQPVSQSCTADQVAALGLASSGLFGRHRGEDAEAAMAAWSEGICLAALATYGAAEIGLEGVIVGPLSAEAAGQVARRAASTRVENGPPPPRASGDFFDFLIAPAGLRGTTDAWSDALDRWATVEDWLARLKIGGLAAIGLRYRAEAQVSTSSAAGATLSRNEISQWALRLIGSGYSVAPLAFAPVADLILDSQGLAAFILIIQRV